MRRVCVNTSSARTPGPRRSIHAHIRNFSCQRKPLIQQFLARLTITALDSLLLSCFPPVRKAVVVICQHGINYPIVLCREPAFGTRCGLWCVSPFQVHQRAGSLNNESPLPGRFERPSIVWNCPLLSTSTIDRSV